MPSRDKDSSDFDLEAFIDLFDEALTSDDPSVQKTLQHLMVIAALARNHARHDHREGPMRRMFENQRDLIRRIEQLEQTQRPNWQGPVPTPHIPPVPVPVPMPIITTPNTNWPPQPGPYPPGTIWAQNISGPDWTSASSGTLDPGYGAVPPYPPGTIFGQNLAKYQTDITQRINGDSPVAERVEVDSWKTAGYTGSTVGGTEF